MQSEAWREDGWVEDVDLGVRTKEVVESSRVSWIIQGV